ncbi:hypothetical protein THAOC_09364 [Thalassiosira oceanica]|uniref:Uncharacterized protein n=1 Tax=Thalassiosira oceanica TaxID=159749 RepID=K0SVC2_THAOC|nr:hypothetical protein THAOC_09364 [Thalassiosira oceanica]|eukprot:EJK69385.1 hypothetical protein THAOC_09364 [Thalassiosira oceanica]
MLEVDRCSPCCAAVQEERKLASEEKERCRLSSPQHGLPIFAPLQASRKNKIGEMISIERRRVGKSRGRQERVRSTRPVEGDSTVSTARSRSPSLGGDARSVRRDGASEDATVRFHRTGKKASTRRLHSTIPKEVVFYSACLGPLSTIILDHARCGFLTKAQTLLVNEKVDQFLRLNPDLDESIRTQPHLYEAALSRLQRALVFQNENSLDAHEAALCQAQSSLQYLNGSTRITVEYDGIENAVQDSGTFLLPNSVLFGDDLPSDLDACRADLVCAIKFHRDIVTRLRSDVDDAKKDLLLMVSSEDERIQFVADKQGRLEQGCPSTRDDPDTSSEVQRLWRVSTQTAEGVWAKMFPTVYARSKHSPEELNALKSIAARSFATSIFLSRLPMSNLPIQVVSDSRAQCQAAIKVDSEHARACGVSIECASSLFQRGNRRTDRGSYTSLRPSANSEVDAPSDFERADKAPVPMPSNNVSPRQPTRVPALSHREVKRRIGSSKQRRANLRALLFTLLGKFFSLLLPLSAGTRNLQRCSISASIAMMIVMSVTGLAASQLKATDVPSDVPSAPLDLHTSGEACPSNTVMEFMSHEIPSESVPSNAMGTCMIQSEHDSCHLPSPSTCMIQSEKSTWMIQSEHDSCHLPSPSSKPGSSFNEPFWIPEQDKCEYTSVCLHPLQFNQFLKCA